MSVDIFVGYVGSEMKRLAKYGVLSSTTQRNGADLETTMRILDGLGALSRAFDKIDVSGKVGRKRRTLVGAVIDHNGGFQAIDDSRSSEQVHPINSETNLISVTPLLSGLLQKPIGVEVSSILDPRIQPGDVIEVNSHLNSEFNDRYKVIECQLKWVMQSKCWGI